jgi:hypothetical protein
VHFVIGFLGTSAAIGGLQIFNVNGNRDSVWSATVDDEIQADRREVKSLRGGEDDRAKRGVEEVWSEDEEWERTGEEQIVCSWDDEEFEFTKNIFGGAAGTRKGSPASRPELRGKSPGGMELCTHEVENANESENTGELENARLTSYENLVLRASRIAQQQRSAASSRPPSRLSPRRCDEAMQTEDTEVNPAPGGETPGPRRDSEDRLGRLELV